MEVPDPPLADLPSTTDAKRSKAEIGAACRDAGS
jgi:hypothetical protein